MFVFIECNKEAHKTMNGHNERSLLNFIFKPIAFQINGELGNLVN